MTPELFYIFVGFIGGFTAAFALAINSRDPIEEAERELKLKKIQHELKQYTAEDNQ
jgi:glycerol uptake facilitator-like aquaporin